MKLFEWYLVMTETLILSKLSFISQVAGMMVNNACFFIFWLLFFDRFNQVKGWGSRRSVASFS